MTIHPSHVPSEPIPVPVHHGVRLTAFIACDRCGKRSETAWLHRNAAADVDGILTFCGHHTTDLAPLLRDREGWSLA